MRIYNTQQNLIFFSSSSPQPSGRTGDAFSAPCNLRRTLTCCCWNLWWHKTEERKLVLPDSMKSELPELLDLCHSDRHAQFVHPRVWHQPYGYLWMCTGFDPSSSPSSWPSKECRCTYPLPPPIPHRKFYIHHDNQKTRVYVHIVMSTLFTDLQETKALHACKQQKTQRQLEFLFI